jgi:hypothetical protein
MYWVKSLGAKHCSAWCGHVSVGLCSSWVVFVAEKLFTFGISLRVIWLGSDGCVISGP